METLRNLYCWMVARLSCEKGQTVIEYVLVIVLASIAFLWAFNGPGIPTELTETAGQIANEIDLY